MQITERDLKIIQSEGQKSVSEINEKTKAEELRIKATSELKGAEIRALTEILKSKLNASGEAEAKLTAVQADGACTKVLAETESIVALKNAEAVKIQGQGENDLKGVLGLRRLYQFLNTKLEIIRGMSQNPNLKIFGNSDDSNLSQLAAYSIMNGSSHL
jgi:hypothetical protein